MSGVSVCRSAGARWPISTSAPAEALVLFDPVLIPPSEMVVHNQGEDHGITQVALRQRATFPSKAAAFEAYKGAGCL